MEPNQNFALFLNFVQNFCKVRNFLINFFLISPGLFVYTYLFWLVSGGHDLLCRAIPVHGGRVGGRSRNIQHSGAGQFTLTSLYSTKVWLCGGRVGMQYSTQLHRLVYLFSGIFLKSIFMTKQIKFWMHWSFFIVLLFLLLINVSIKLPRLHPPPQYSL